MDDRLFSQHDMNINQDISEMKKDMGYLRDGVKELKEGQKDNFDKLWRKLEDMNTSQSSMRNDINLANQKNIELSLKTKEIEGRVELLEVSKIQQNTVIKFLNFITSNNIVVFLIIGIVYFLGHLVFKIF